MSFSIEQRAEKRTLAWLPALIVAVFVLAGCGADKPADTKARTASSGGLDTKPVLVELAEVKRGVIEEVLERSAPLQAEAQVQVLARTQNPAEELLVEEGDKVAKGQVLLRLERDRQQTEHAQALSQLEEARIEFARQENLYRQLLISESDYQNANFAFKRAELLAETAQRQLDYTEVRAPIQGTITSRTVKVGDQVDSGTPIFEIIDLDSTVAIIHVPEQYLPKLKPDMDARMISTTFGDQTFAGYVKRISPVVEARAGTVKVVVGVRELGPLRPGMWVDVELVLEAKSDAVLIPKRAIAYDNDQIFAYKVYTDSNGVKRARRQLVVRRNQDVQHIEPAEGFEAGELIVVAGHLGLKDDSPIRELEAASSGVLPPMTSGALTNSASISAASTPGGTPGK